MSPKRLCACAFAFALLVAAARAAAASDFFISPSGDDSNAGTAPSTAWRSTKNANAMRLPRGARVLFEGGVEHDLRAGAGGLVVHAVAPEGAPIVITTYGAQPAVLLVDATASDAVQVVDTASVEIANLQLVNTRFDAPSSVQFNGVRLLATAANGTQRLRGATLIRDVSVTRFFVGVSIEAAACAGFDGVRIVRATATQCTHTGIQSTGGPACYASGGHAHANIVVEASEAAYCTGDAALKWAWSGSGIVLTSVDGARVVDSVAHHNGGANGHQGGGPCGIWGATANNLTIARCVAYNNSMGHAPFSSSDGCGFDFDGGVTNSVLEYSLSFFNDGPGVLFCDYGTSVATANNTVRFFVSYQDGLAADNGTRVRATKRARVHVQ